MTGLDRTKPDETAACEEFGRPSRRYQQWVWFGTAVHIHKCDKLWIYHKQVTIILESRYTCKYIVLFKSIL